MFEFGDVTADSIEFSYGDIGGDNPESLNLRYDILDGDHRSRHELGEVYSNSDGLGQTAFTSYSETSAVADLTVVRDPTQLELGDGFHTIFIIADVSGVADVLIGEALFVAEGNERFTQGLAGADTWSYRENIVNYSDESFDGFDHETLPDTSLDFSLKNSDEATQPEAIVDIKHEGEWVRLPITEASTRTNKDGPADVTSTSEVRCPATWGNTQDGKVPIYEYVGADRENESSSGGFDLGRIYYWSEQSEEYHIEQFGYVAAIGPDSASGVFRFNVYDAADLMGNIEASATFDDPTAGQVVRFSMYDDEYGLDRNSVIPVQDISITVPASVVNVQGELESLADGVPGWLDETTPIVDSVFGDSGISEQIRERLDDIAAGGQKHFRRNRDTLLDVLNWLTEQIGGVWHFKPVDDGVILVVNNGTDDGPNIARNAYYDGEFDPSGLDYIQGHNPIAVDVLNNSSLEDLKPINYLELNGESADSFLGINTDRHIFDGPIGEARGHSDQYPHVEVRYPPLLRRTGGRELGPTPIDSGKTTLDEAESAARKEFLKAHEDSTSGSMEVRATPTIRPYDYVGAVPVVNDAFDADMQPIQYEVNSVRHHTTGTTPYTSHLGVSMAIDESALDIESSMQDINA